MPDAAIQPNAYGVTLEATDEAIARDLDRWDWGHDPTNPKAVAAIVMRVIREQTMACIDDNGDKLCFGLFEHEADLTAGLANLVDHFIDVRCDRDGRIRGEEAADAIRLQRNLQALADRLAALIDA